MGYIRHNAFIVTSWNGKALLPLRDDAVKIFGASMVSELVASPIDTYESFLIAPDGSKEGWTDSDEHDKKRDEFVEAIKKYEYDDGSSSVAWCEVLYGDEAYNDHLVRSSNMPEATDSTSSTDGSANTKLAVRKHKAATSLNRENTK